MTLSKVFSKFQIGMYQISKLNYTKKKISGVMTLMRILFVFRCTGTPVILKKYVEDT